MGANLSSELSYLKMDQEFKEKLRERLVAPRALPNRLHPVKAVLVFLVPHPRKRDVKVVQPLKVEGEVPTSSELFRAQVAAVAAPGALVDLARVPLQGLLSLAPEEAALDRAAKVVDAVVDFGVDGEVGGGLGAVSALGLLAREVLLVRVLVRHVGGQGGRRGHRHLAVRTLVAKERGTLDPGRRVGVDPAPLTY
jgi:hypothetical protein